MVGPAPLRFVEDAEPLPPEPVMPSPPAVPASHVLDDTPTAPDIATLVPPKPAEPTKPVPTPEVRAPKPVSVLPDDTQREIRPEDVLPYFQFPTAPDNAATLSLPRPATAPASSATYNLQ